MDTTNTTFRGTRRRRGFSFTEVLFAVMILGIGFIMVAAIFPVALRQTQSNGEESISASAARGAVNVLDQIATNRTMPATNGTVLAFSGGPPNANSSATLTEGLERRRAVLGNLILPSDPRYGWVAFYRRGGTRGAGAIPYFTPQPDWSQFAQVYVITVKAPSGTVFTTAPDIDRRTRNDDTSVPVLRATITDGGADADTLAFVGGDTATAAELAGEGAYVIVADASGIAPQFTGRIYRLGNPLENSPQSNGRPLRYELAPGGDFTPERDASNNLVSALNNVPVYLVGRAAGEGVPQDIGVYTTFITVH